MILVDTSAWIEFFRTRGKVAMRVGELLDEHDVALCGPTLMEIRRGLFSKTDRDRVLPLLTGCHFLLPPQNLWSEAGELGVLAGRKGTTVGSMDLLIAAHALSHRVPILAADPDYRRLQEAGIPLLLA